MENLSFPVAKLENLLIFHWLIHLPNTIARIPGNHFDQLTQGNNQVVASHSPTNAGDTADATLRERETLLRIDTNQLI